MDQVRQDFGGGRARKCDTHKALEFPPLWFGTRRSVVQIHSPRPLQHPTFHLFTLFPPLRPLRRLVRRCKPIQSPDSCARAIPARGSPRLEASSVRLRGCQLAQGSRPLTGVLETDREESLALSGDSEQVAVEGSHLGPQFVVPSVILTRIVADDRERAFFFSPVLFRLFQGVPIAVRRAGWTRCTTLRRSA